MAVELVSYIDSEPSKSLQCKFVILSHSSGSEFVLFGPYERFPFHAHLIAQFCRDRNIPVESKEGGEVFEIIDPAYTISGGGWMEIDPLNKRFRCYGASKAYGKYPSAILERLTLTHTLWVGYQIQIDVSR